MKIFFRKAKVFHVMEAVLIHFSLTNFYYKFERNEFMKT